MIFIIVDLTLITITLLCIQSGESQSETLAEKFKATSSCHKSRNPKKESFLISFSMLRVK